MCEGQVIIGVLATSRAVSESAARMVKVQYEPEEPILTIEVKRHN